MSLLICFPFFFGHSEAERRRKEEAERKAKLDEIAEKQRQRERELEEKEMKRRESLLGRSTDGLSRSSDLPGGSRPIEPAAVAPAAAAAAAAASSAPAPAKYVPRFRRGETAVQAPAAAPPAEPDRWGGGSSRQEPDRWRPGGSSSGAKPATWASTRGARTGER